ncbi:MAG: nucleotidyltransferase domain-containing protein [Candidatus Eremiobacteraeota bacterium]|nr:nucleotidyltransferase domain-containing protein [Candidatus Eremiobacteraeota bacterium]MCW5867521.1 nucleotidyltransferase domain-containing protein [Candidatus Eremiobacteraeota bacterium]
MDFQTDALDRLVFFLRAEDWAALVGVLDELVGPLSAVLLYGSRARGQQHADSDYDLLVVAEQAGEGIRFLYGGLDLDIEVASAALYAEPLEGRLYQDCGLILRDDTGALAAWLERLRTRRLSGPPPLSAAYRLRMAGWLDRMLRRSQHLGACGALRRAALASSLPEAALECLGRWPGSPLQNLKVLRAEWPSLHAAIEDWAGAASVGEQLLHLERGVRLVAGAFTAGPKGSGQHEL